MCGTLVFVSLDPLKGTTLDGLSSHYWFDVDGSGGMVRLPSHYYNLGNVRGLKKAGRRQLVESLMKRKGLTSWRYKEPTTTTAEWKLGRTTWYLGSGAHEKDGRRMEMEAGPEVNLEDILDTSP